MYILNRIPRSFSNNSATPMAAPTLLPPVRNSRCIVEACWAVGLCFWHKEKVSERNMEGSEKERSSGGKKGKRKVRVCVWANGPLLRSKVKEVHGRKEDTVQAKVMVLFLRTLSGGQKGAHSLFFAAVDLMEALCGQQDTLLPKPVRSRHGSWQAAVTQR